MKKLGFGTMRLPTLGDDSKVDLERFKEMVDRFLEQGFTYFDTSYVYHGGMSESALKEALVDRHPRDHFTITTKLPIFLVKEKADVRRFFQEQLTRLGTDYVDYYWLHAVNAATYETAKQTDAFGELAALKAEGLTRHIGLSFHDSAEVLDRILTEHPEMEYVQLQLNYFDWESSSVQARKCYETAVRHGKQIVVMEPVKGGSLAKLPEELEQIYRKEQPNLSAASWGIRFAASLPHVLVVLSGMSNMEQVEDNTSYMKDFQPLSGAEQDAVKQVVTAIKSKITVAEFNEIAPMVNQIEMHPYFPQFEREDVHKQYGVQLEAWGPLAEAKNGIFEHEKLRAIGGKYGKSVAQVILRWHIQRGVAAIPKSVHKERIEENINIFDFALSAEDMDAIAALDTKEGLYGTPFNSAASAKMLKDIKIHD